MQPDCPQSGQHGRFWAVVRANISPGGAQFEDAFSDWWSHKHVPEYVRRLGFSRGIRLRAVQHERQVGSAEHKYLAVYEIDAIATFNDALEAGPPWGPWHDDVDRYLCDWERTYYSVLNRTLVDDRRGDYWAVAKVDLSSAADAEAFNAWYDEVHLPEIIANPGFHRAWRTRVTPDTNELGPRRQCYWAVYEVDSPEDLVSARARRSNRGIPDWDGVWGEHLDNVQIVFYERIFEIDHPTALDTGGAVLNG